MLLKDFLSNPIQKGDATTNLKLIKQNLDNKWNNYSKKKDIKMTILRQSKEDIYWIWMVFPSETDRTNTYDIVFRFRNPKPTDRITAIGKFDMGIFANVPSFAYTFAYAYNEHNLFIRELGYKLGKTFMEKSPDVRNKYQLILYDKYVYYGAQYIMETKVLNRMIADSKCKPFNQRKFFAEIRTLQTIMDEYHVAEDVLKGKKKKAKIKKNNDTDSINRVNKNKKSINSINKNSKRLGTMKKKGSIKKK